MTNNLKDDLQESSIWDFKEPLNSEITVLPADIPGKALGWSVREYMGSPLCYYITGEGPGEIVKNLDELKPGMQVVAWGQTLITVDVIDPIDPTKAKGLTGGTHAFLEHGGDDRQCWVCTGLANLRGVTKMSKTTKVI